MAWEIERDGEEIVAAFQGRVGVDETLEAVAAVAAADAAGDATHLLVDFTSVSSLDFSVEDLHRLAIGIRLNYQRGPEHRFAFVAGSGGVEKMVRLFVEVRDLLTARQVRDLAQIGIFESIGEARHWATAPAGETPTTG